MSDTGTEGLSTRDVAVVGDGVAGLAAAFFAARAGLSTVLHGGVSGGELASIATITDYPGIASVAGYELCPTLLDQAMTAGAEYSMDWVESIERDETGFVLRHTGGTTRTTAVIVATGTDFGRFGIDGEDELAGNGISHCASCDGPLYPGRAVAVAGSSDHALQEALTLAELGLEVLVAWSGRELSSNRHPDRAVAESGGIEILDGTRLTQITKNGSGLEVELSNGNGASESRSVAALFSYPPMIPRSTCVEGLAELDPLGFVVTDIDLQTTCPGLFAAGAVRADALDLAITAAADGAVAAASVARRIRG